MVSMNKLWLPFIFGMTFFILGAIKERDECSLSTYYRADRVIKIKRFDEIKKTLTPKDQELFELWESMLTGRTAPLSRWIKERYKLLALNHLFTPSGFHLSAVLLPIFKLIKNTRIQLMFMMTIGLGLFWVPGMGALKRMVLIKSHQKIFGLKTGFFMALLLDIFFGSFQDSTLSFTYSFLFLGIIYSGSSRVALIFLIFAGQMTIAFFQGNQVSPLLIILSPILNLCFGFLMPALFALAIPMWGWQVKSALFLLNALQWIVDLSAHAVSLFPFWEIHCVTLITFYCLFTNRRKTFYLLLFILSNTLNPSMSKVPSAASYEYAPIGEVKKEVRKDEKDLIYFKDGKCERTMVSGLWWEKCSPLRKSTRKNKSKKLSYPS
jgi:hypothetical protein